VLVLTVSWHLCVQPSGWQSVRGTELCDHLACFAGCLLVQVLLQSPHTTSGIIFDVSGGCWRPL